MIRTPNRQSAQPALPCYEEAPNAVFGITFEKVNGTRRFVPYAFLAALDFDCTGELVFHFSSGALAVRGAALEALWKAACKGELARVREGGASPNDKAAWVREIVLTEPETTPSIPPFPFGS